MSVQLLSNQCHCTFHYMALVPAVISGLTSQLNSDSLKSLTEKVYCIARDIWIWLAVPVFSLTNNVRCLLRLAVLIPTNAPILCFHVILQYPSVATLWWPFCAPIPLSFIKFGGTKWCMWKQRIASTQNNSALCIHCVTLECVCAHDCMFQGTTFALRCHIFLLFREGSIIIILLLGFRK